MRKIDLISIILVGIGILSMIVTKDLEMILDEFVYGFFMGMGLGLMIIGFVMIIINNLINKSSKDHFLGMWL